MENNIQTFHNNEFGELKVMLIDDKYWFPATDCAVFLGYADPYKAIKQHTLEDGWAICPVIDNLGAHKRKGSLMRATFTGSL